MHLARLACLLVAANLFAALPFLDAALERLVRRESRPSGNTSQPDSQAASQPAAIRLTYPELSLTGFPVLITIQLVDINGRVAQGAGPYELQVDLGGDCAFTGDAVFGSLRQGAGTSRAQVVLNEGRAGLLVSNAREEVVMVEARGPTGPSTLTSVPANGLRFLSQDADADGDGLTNLEEFQRGTNPLAADTDEDGMADPGDNCPAVANLDQSDTRHPGGRGDACDDPDDDGVFDITDSCPDWGNPAQEDLDGDGTGDACQVGALASLTDGTFTLPFQATDVLFDPQRPYLYATDKASKKVWFVNLETGQAEAGFPFDLTPESLALSPDGSRLYSTLLARPHTPYPQPTGVRDANIVVFDLTIGLIERQFHIIEDPFQILITNDGHMVVTPGSGQYLPLSVFNIASGVLTGKTSESFYRQMRLGMHPSGGGRVYGADTQSATLRRFDLPFGRISYRWGSAFGHRIFGRVWPSPLGDKVLTQGGDLFTTGITAATDVKFMKSLSEGSINAVAYDQTERVIFTGEGPALRYYNLVTGLEIGSTPMMGTVDFMGLSQGNVFSVLVEADQTVVVRQPNPVTGGASNLPPTAHFTVDPATGGTTNHQFHFDASASTDPQDTLTALRFRWDFEDDGIWETTWSSNPVATKRFDVAGPHSARVQVRDSLSLIGEMVQAFDVTFAPDPGEPGPSGPPFDLPFSVTDAIVDPQRPYAYVSDKAGRRICFLNLETGLIEKQFTFELMPEALVITPDGSRLFAALLTREHSGVWWDEDGHEGYIASFDLTTKVKDRQYRIAEDPYDLVATSDGHLVVASGSGQHTYVRVFNALTGAQTGASRTSYQGDRLALHPSERSVYRAASPSSSPSDLFRHDLLAGGGISYRWDSPYHGDYRTGRNVWASPEGERVIAGGGDVFSVGETPATDLRFIQQLSPGFIDDLSFDVLRRVIFTAEGSTLGAYNLVSYLEMGRQTLPGPIAFVGASGPSVYALLREAGRTHVVALPHPAPNGASNAPPAARFTVSPSSGGTVLDEFRFDSSVTTDAEDPATVLRYRWDFDNDLVWDTPWSSDPVVNKQFSEGGTKIIRLQVRDSLSLVGEATQVVHVAFNADPGQPAAPTASFELPFLVADAVFDPDRPYVYVTEKAGRRVCFVNLETMLIEKQFSFDMLPELAVLTPDGSRLFVTLLAQEHGYTGIPGAIASFNLDSQVKDRQFGIPIEPIDLLATSNGQLVISSYASPIASIKTFQAVTGAQLGSSYNYYSAGKLRLALHPSERKFYAASDYYYAPMYHFDLQSNGAIVARWEDIYRGAHRVDGELWGSPLGDILITRGGDVFTATDELDTDLRFIESLSAGKIESLAFDAPRRAFFTAEGSTLRSYNLGTRLPMRDRPLGGTISSVGFQGDSIYALVSGTKQTNVIAFRHPALGGASNTAPMAGFIMAPSPATTRVDVTFDATSSADAEDAGSHLRYRWDLDNDGTWDGPWSSDPIAIRRFHTNGSKIIRLQVTDSMALMGELTQILNVSFENDPGSPGAPANSFELPFTVTDAVFDPVRPYLYVAEKVSKRVHFINLATGFVERMFSLNNMPESLAITPDGSRLFAALQSREHAAYSEYTGPGSVASFDLAQQVKDRQFQVPIEVRDLVATSNEVIVTVGYAGYGGYLRTFNAATGAPLGISADLYPRGALALALHPSERLVYGGDSGISPPDSLRFDLSPEGAIAYRWDSQYHGDHRLGGRLWVSPRGDVLVTQGGDVFTANGTSQTNDLIYLRNLAFNGLSGIDWDVSRDLIITLEDKHLRRYSLSSYGHVESTVLPASGSFMGRHGAYVFALLPQGPRTQLVRQAVSNRPPVAEAGANQTLECTAMLGAMVSLDAAGSSDPDSLEGAWDDISQYEWLEVESDGSLEPLVAGKRAEAFLPLGMHRLRLRVTDAGGATAVDDVTVSVQDTLPPALTILPQPAVLWPPNHRMVNVHLGVTAVDQCDPSPSVTLLGATSSEPDDGNGPRDGHTIHDIQEADEGSPDMDVLLRAERSGNGSGRIYRLSYDAVDFSGLTTEAAGHVIVPHDQGTSSLDPLEIRVRQEGETTVIERNLASGTIPYRGIRGDVRNLRTDGDTIWIGPVTCLDLGSIQQGIGSWTDGTTPPIGRAWFYLVEFDDAVRSSYSSMETGRELVASAVDCTSKPTSPGAGNNRPVLEDSSGTP